MNGLILLNKRKGITSHDAITELKEFLKLDKVGHSGTLDSNASGILPVGVGSSTRLLRFLLESPKEYFCLMNVHEIVKEKDLIKVFKKFIGEINQQVPKRSAVKRRIRKRKIYELELLNIEGRLISFRALVQAGTYIRVLCVDLGEKLGVNAHMQELERTKVAHLNIALSHKIENIKYLNKVLLPCEKIVEHLSKIVVKNLSLVELSNGNSVRNEFISSFENFEKDDYVRVLNEKDKLVLVGESLCDSKKLTEIVVNPLTVIKK